MRIAVVGGLAAGPTAASEAKRQAPDAHVVLFEQGRHVSVGACEIPYYVADRLGEAFDLIVLTPEELARKKGVEVRLRHRVVGLDGPRGGLTVEALAFGSRHDERFDRIILATGARARRLDVPGMDAAGVFTVRGYEDATGLKAWLAAEAVRHVVVVGGGYIGIEMAEAMCDHGLRASILESAGRVLPATLAPEMCGMIGAAVKNGGVAVRAERPTAILTDALGRVTAVTTDRGERIGCQAVIVAIGVEPRTELAVAGGVALGTSGAVAVDAHMKTNVRNVWACGDLVEVMRASDRRPVFWPLAPVGRRTARVAARNAARTGGATDEMRPISAAVAVKAFGMEAAAVGIDVEAAQAAGLDAVARQVRSWTRTRAFPGSRPIDVRLVVERKTGRLLGGQLVAEEGAALRADVLVPLIRAGATARELAEDTDLIYNPPLAPAVDPLRVAAREASKAARA